MAFPLFVLLIVIWQIFPLFANLKRYLHLLQLDDYDPLRLFRLLLKQPEQIQWIGLDAIGIGVVLFGNLLRMFVGLVYRQDGSLIVAYAPWVIVLIGLGVWNYGLMTRLKSLIAAYRSAKKPLIMTSRAKRIYIVSGLIGICVLLLYPVSYLLTWLYPTVDVTALAYAHWNLHLTMTVLFLMGSVYLAERLAFVWAGLAVWILQPYEKYTNNRYIADARRILAEINPIVIGITGSYGKTGTKEILSALLAEKYNIFRPPGSYNTILGVTRAVREGLRPQHQAFVVEMGAYRIGSIARLCKLVQPKYGLITIIGVQHLERFGSQQAIRQAKGELVKSLPPEGVAVLNGDDPLSREIGAEYSGKVVYFSMTAGDQTVPTVVADNLQLGPDGSSFDILFPDGERLTVKLSLLGRAAVANSIAAIAMADCLGVPRRLMGQVLATLPHTRHRLEPIKRDGGVTVIDDAFNSNPIGAASALEVLAMATNGRRILVTPGMVELGELEEQSNYNFGVQAATACDLAMLVGVQRVEPIRRGLIDGGFNPENIVVVESLKVGLEYLAGYLQPGDTMLLENDLPDQYNKQ